MPFAVRRTAKGMALFQFRSVGRVHEFLNVAERRRCDLFRQPRMSLRDGLRSELEWARTHAEAHISERRPKRVASASLG